MKCNRCGETCRDNQVFCLKCGTPIQVVPDFNLIEEELANSVGKLLEEELKNEPEDKERELDATLDFLSDEKYPTKENIPQREIEAELAYSELEKANSNNRKRNIMPQQVATDFQVDASDFKDKQPIPSSKKRYEKEKQKQYEKKMFKIKVSIIVIVAAALIGGVIFVFSGLNNESSKETFTSLYNAGFDAYTSKDYPSAMTHFEEAKNVVSDKNDKIKVDKSLLNVYEQIENTEDKQIDVLKELIAFEPGQYEFYKKLISIYDKKQMTQEIEELIASITDQSLLASLSDYAVTGPVFNYEEGVYDKKITLKLTASSKDVIYYTLDESDPTTKSTKYSEETAIPLENQGHYTVKAISVNEKGMSSKIVTKTYDIQNNTIEAPVMSLASGQYKEDCKIEIDVPGGLTCYYTYDDVAKVPTMTDTKYDGPIPMLRGKKILSAVFVTATGVTSEVTQNIYELNVERQHDYSYALSTVQRFIVNSNVATIGVNGEYVTANGDLLEFNYNSIASISNSEYYIIKAVEKTASNSVVTTMYFGVDTVTGALVKVIEDPANPENFILTE